MNCLCCGKPLKTDEPSGWHKACVKRFFGTSVIPELEIDNSALEHLAIETAGKGLYDFIQTESLPTVSGADIRDITVTKEETASHFVKKEVDGQGNIAWYRDAADTEANRLPDNSQLNNLAQAVSGLSIRSCVNYNATDEELGSYGLETPVMTLTWTCRKDGKDITTTLLIGSMNPEGTGYYVKLKDSKAVNLAGKENVDKVLNAEY